MSETLRLNWKKALGGYRLDPRDTAGDNHVGAVAFAGSILEGVEDGPGVFVVARGQQTTRVRIDSETSLVLFELANMRPTPKAVRRFAETWGLLTPGTEANVSDFYRASAELSTCLHLMSADRWSELQGQMAGRRVKAGHRRFEKFRLSTYQEPSNLRDFCFLHLQGLIQQEATILRCPRCGGFVLRKRNTRQTCSDACRKALSKRRLRRGNSTNGLDDAEHGRIAELWRARCDILIQPDRGHAFISKPEAGDPPDPEFLRLLGEWMVAHRIED